MSESIGSPQRRERALSEHAAARVAYAVAAVELSEYAAAVVPTSSDSLADPGEFITQAKQGRKLALILMMRAVLLERAKGRSWKQIAHSFGYTEEWVRAEYEPIEREWLAWLSGHDEPAETIAMAMLLPSHNVPRTEVEIRATAAMLDEWCRQRASVQDPEPGQRLVTDGLSG